MFIGSADHFLYAFPVAGCGAAVCPPRWKAHLGAAVVDSSVAVAGRVAYVGDFTGHLYAFTASGCGAAVCTPLWTGINFTSGFASAPSVVNGLVFVGEGPASAIPDAGVYAFNAAGCGAATCRPITFVQLSSNQNYLGAPLAVGEGKVFMSSDDNTTGRSDVFALGLAKAPGQRR